MLALRLPLGLAKTMIVACSLLALSACGKEDGPRELFRSELTEKVDVMAKRLNRLHPGMETIKGTVLANGHTKEITHKIPSAVAVANAVEDVALHFERISMAFLLEDIQGFDGWADDLRTDVAKHHARLKKISDKVTIRVGDNVKQYASGGAQDNYGSTGIDFIFRDTLDTGDSIGLSADGKLYFRTPKGNVGYYPDKVLDIDLEGWLGEVKSQSMKHQDLSNEE